MTYSARSSRQWQAKRRFTFSCLGDSSQTSTEHSFFANPQVEAFEQAHGITLPAPYREFLLKVANGGCGPSQQGLIDLGKQEVGQPCLVAFLLNRTLFSFCCRGKSTSWTRGSPSTPATLPIHRKCTWAREGCSLVALRSQVAPVNGEPID